MTETTRSAAFRYGLALVAVVAATGSRVLLDPILGELQPFVTFHLALAAVAPLAGLGPALVVLAFGLEICRYLFMEPRYSLGAPEFRGQMSSATYLLVGVTIAILSEAVRSARRRALEGQEGLRREMAERTRAERALRDRETRFRALIEHSSDAITLISPDGRVLYLSPSITRILGYTPDELIGEDGFQHIHPEDREAAALGLADAVARPGEAVVFGFRVRHKDGSWREVENVGTSLLHEPSVAAVVVNTRDVTERAAMETRLRDGEARFRAFMDHSPAIGYLKDDQGRYLWGNHAWTRQFDRPEAELLGRDDFSLWPESTARVFRASDLRALEAGHAVEVVEAMEDRHFLSLKFPLDHDGARLVGGMTLDVTDRVLAEQAVRRSEDLLHAQADSMPQMVWAARLDGSTDWFNRRWFEYTGLTEAQTFARDGWKRILHPEDVDRCHEVWYRSVASGEPYEIEYRLKEHATGRYRWHLGRALPVRDGEGRIVRWYGTCTDIDDQKHAEQAAEAANKAKDRFLAVLSHELRTPLTPVLLSVSSLLEAPDLGDHVRPALELIRHNIDLESRLIDDLLDVVEITRGDLPIRPETVDAHAVIARAVDQCRPELDASGANLSLDLAAVETTLSADPARLRQALGHLIKNAVKFTPSGGSIAIRTRSEPVPEVDGEGESDAGRAPLLVIEVVDTGVGIDPDFLPRMFEAFEQGESSPWARRFGGLGLGLAISRSVVSGHGGTLSAHSDGPGLGATFRITLPTTATTRPRPDHRKSDPAPVAATLPPPASSPSPAPPEALHILLIEDDPSTLSVLSRLLRRNRHAVTTADCVSAALAAADRESDAFDLIISDIGLPDGNGVDLMRTLQARRPVPAIALSGFGRDEDIRKGRSAGFLAHLTKPVDFRTLESTICDVLAGSS